MTYELNPTLESVLNDPLIALMRTADGVDAASFETLLRATSKRLSGGDRGARSAVGQIAAAALRPASWRRQACGTLCTW